MMVKNVVFLFGLLLAGCGVMNNPTPDDKEIGAGDTANSTANPLETTMFSKIDTASLTLSDTNRIFVDSIGDMRLDALTSYKIFDTLASTKQFLTDLNTSAQTLASGDLATVESWIKDIKDANIDYQHSNLLFYPILQSSDCGLKESASVKDKNATIIIQNSRNECDDAFIYHVLLYKVDKRIQNITVKAFDEGSVTISNSAKY